MRDRRGFTRAQRAPGRTTRRAARQTSRRETAALGLQLLLLDAGAVLRDGVPDKSYMSQHDLAEIEAAAHAEADNIAWGWSV